MSLWERQSIMEGPYVRRSILRLPGLTKADYFPVEDVADMRLLQGVGNPLEGPEEPAPESVHPPDKIPRTFDGNVAHWLYGTNLRCWQCDFAFDGPPKFAPTHVREAENGGKPVKKAAKKAAKRGDDAKSVSDASTAAAKADDEK